MFVCEMFVFQSQGMVSTLEGSLHELQTEYDALKLQQQKVRMQFFWGFSITTCVWNAVYNLWSNAGV